MIPPETVAEIQFESPAPGGRAGASGTGAAVTSGGAPAAGPSGFPRGFKVDVSMDGKAWTGVADGSGTTGTTVITFPASQAKFVRISLTATTADAPAWSIQSLRIYAARGAAKPSR